MDFNRLRAVLFGVMCLKSEFTNTSVFTRLFTNNIVNLSFRDTEVAVSGKRQGVTKKLLSTPAGRLKICKVELLRLYQRLILVDFPEIGVELGIQSDTTYDQVKRAAAQYTEACDLLKTTYFMGWTTKPSDINAFCTD